MSDEPAIEVARLAKSYRTGAVQLPVLQGVDFQVAPGEFVSIQGESGCGKTTFLNVIGGLETPDSGYVKWNGVGLDGLNRNALARERARFIGIVFQSYYLVPEIDVLQNVLMAMRIAQQSSAKDSVAAAKTMLERVGLGDRGGQMPATLSGGERQRVAIARALLTRPRLILADEPTGNLDERTGNAIMDLLESLCRETQTALVLVTHNAEHAARADRQLTLTKGCFDA